MASLLFSSFIFLIEAVFFIDFRCQSMTIDQYFPTAPFPNVSKYTTALFTWCSKSLYIYTIRVDSKSLNSNHPKVMPCNIDIVCYAFNILLTIAKLPSPCFFKVCNMLFECLNRIHIFQQTVLGQVFFLLQHVTTNLTSCNGIEHK